MTLHIKIVGAGLSGLLIAYHLKKLIPQESDVVQVEIFDNQSKSTDIASTISMAWLNSAYPCSDQYDQSARLYDQFRIDALKAWNTLNESLMKDGILDIVASQKEAVEINSDLINSLYVFFNENEQREFVDMVRRLNDISDTYQVKRISQETIEPYFPFLAHFPPYFLHNIASESLVNPYHLRTQLINYLQHANVTFHWETVISPEQMQFEPTTHWILAAGNGCLDLVKNTRLDGIQFVKDSVAEVIYCSLSTPLDLKGKVFHIGPSQTTPGFHLRNNEQDLSKIKIVIDYDTRKEGSLNENAQAIFTLLRLPVASYQCTNTIRRPMTPDGRPLIEMSLGNHHNIHMVYGHNLYSIAPLYRTFSQNVAAAINQKQPVFLPVPYHSELEQFSLAGRQFRSKLRNLCIFAQVDPQKQRTPLPKNIQPNNTSAPRAKL